MVELLFALLIFSIGMLGLVSAQLGGKRAGYDALQRSVATYLARDMLERIRANSGQADNYQVDLPGEGGARRSTPGVDCESVACTATQLAAFDLWQWERLLIGVVEDDARIGPGGLLSPRACIRSENGAVQVLVSWRATSHSTQFNPVSCGPGPDEDGVGIEGGGSDSRQRVSLHTFIGGNHEH